MLEHATMRHPRFNLRQHTPGLDTNQPPAMPAPGERELYEDGSSRSRGGGAVEARVVADSVGESAEPSINCRTLGLADAWWVMLFLLGRCQSLDARETQCLVLLRIRSRRACCDF